MVPLRIKVSVMSHQFIQSNETRDGSGSSEVPIFLSVKDVAARYSVSVATIWRWTRNKSFPNPIRLGENVTRWRANDLMIWEQRRGGTYSNG